jgi:excinuclease ABC subunit B
MRSALCDATLPYPQQCERLVAVYARFVIVGRLTPAILRFFSMAVSALSISKTGRRDTINTVVCGPSLRAGVRIPVIGGETSGMAGKGGKFEIVSKFKPDGDQPAAIARLTDGLHKGERIQTLLGATGTGKTFTAACVIEQVQRPTLVIAHNKTLAAQLCSEFREFFPNNAVEYFVSYYDYYQPEAYIPSTDTFIEKDSSINEEVNRLRHSATQAVLERRDVIIVASVSCIYGLGSPEQYQSMLVWFHKGQNIDRDDVIRRLVNMQFTRNDMQLTLGTFRVKGDILEIQPRAEEVVYRIEFDWDAVSRISLIDALTGEVMEQRDELTIFPASHFVTDPDQLEIAMSGIEDEMREQVKVFQREGKLIEAQRIEQRTKFDLEMIREMGFCSGIENYSRWMDGRAPGTAPHTLLDYFPKDMLIFVDESHQTIPQLHAMFAGDKRRKDTLIEFGFRLPSAGDNRPLRFEEFEERVKQVVFISATPGPYEKQHSERIVEQIIRPTGLVDPEIVIRPTKGQIDDLIGEIHRRTAKGERILVTTLTKKMSEDLTEYLLEIGVKVNYLHSDIQTLERTEILRDLRLGVYDVIVGINLLREGLDLPEVTLVAILDADKEGFLRSETSLIQTIGRAARNVGGQVIMYADRITGSMERAINETTRRREKQVDYNTAHDITPTTVVKAVRDVLESKKVAEAKSYYKVTKTRDVETLPLDQILLAVTDMEKEMKQAARALDFETAAQLRDEIGRLKKLLPAGAKR